MMSRGFYVRVHWSCPGSMWSLVIRLHEKVATECHYLDVLPPAQSTVLLLLYSFEVLVLFLGIKLQLHNMLTMTTVLTPLLFLTALVTIYFAEVVLE